MAPFTQDGLLGHKAENHTTSTAKLSDSPLGLRGVEGELPEYLH